MSIDKKTLKEYRRKCLTDASFQGKIDFVNSCFVLDVNGRCPFLNDYNLCDLIINEGKESLCQVCRDHPRFRSFFRGRVETGLSLSCEEACRIILDGKDKMTLCSTDNKKERLSKCDKKIISLRQNVLTIVQNREVVISERLNELYRKYDIKISNEVLKEYRNFISTFEILDDAWAKRLDSVSDTIKRCEETEETVFEQLLCYFIYRHVSSAINELDFFVRLTFSLLSAEIVLAIAQCSKLSIYDVARQYSSEIEYSDENLLKAYDFIDRYRRLGKI